MPHNLGVIGINMIGGNRKNHYIIILLIAIVVRIGFMVWFWSGFYVKPASVLSDCYFLQGYGIAAGYGYVEPIKDSAWLQLKNLYDRISMENKRVTPEMVEPLSKEGAVPATQYPPGLPLLVAGINLLFGMRADLVIQIIGIILDTIAVGMVYWIAAVLFSTRIAFIAGLVYAVFPPLARASIAMDPDGLIVAFVIGSFFCLLKSTRARGGAKWGWLAGSGLVLGLGSYLRPDFILMPVFMILGLWAYTRRFFSSLGAMVLIQVIVLVTLFPWAYRNHHVTGRWIFSSTAVGPTLITGLGKFTNPWGYGHADEHRMQEAAAQGFKSAWGSEADLYFREQFFKSILENPSVYLKIILLRVPLAMATPYQFGFANPWKVKEFSELQNEKEDRYQIVWSRPRYVLAAYYDYLLMSVFSLCCFFSVITLFISEWHRRGLVFFVMCPYIYNISSHLLTHIEARYLLPTMYCCIIGLAYVLARGWRQPISPTSEYRNN